MKRILPLFLLFPACLVHAEAEPKKDAPAIIAEASGKLIAALTAAIAQDGPHGVIGVCSEKAPRKLRKSRKPSEKRTASPCGA